MIIEKIMNDQKTAAAKVKSLGGLLFVLFCILFEKRKKDDDKPYTGGTDKKCISLHLFFFVCFSLQIREKKIICINCTLLTFHLYYNNILQHTIQLCSNQAQAMATTIVVYAEVGVM